MHVGSEAPPIPRTRPIKTDVSTSPTTPLFPALRSSHELSQRPSPQKQFPSIHLPASGPATRSFNGLQLKSKFLAIFMMKQLRGLLCGIGVLVVSLASFLVSSDAAAQPAWQPVQGPLMTRWTKEVCSCNSPTLKPSSMAC